MAERTLLLRRRMGMTQEEMARVLRVCRRTLNKLEAGQKVRSSTLDRILILEQRGKGR